VNVESLPTAGQFYFTALERDEKILPWVKAEGKSILEEFSGPKSNENRHED
jgi:hypothetical protein